VSNQTQSRRPLFTAAGPMTKAEKRAAAKEAKARAARLRRRRQLGTVALASLAVIGVIVAAFLYFGGSDPDTTTTSSGTEATPAPSDTFPPLPEGADPALATKPTVTAGTGTLTELKVTTLVKGTGPALAAGQAVTVNYVGVSYTTGAEFDSSWQNSRVLDPFPLGAGRVIPGWDQGLVGVTVGSRVQLDIPSNLAYGDNPQPGQPGGPLRFVVDVLAAS
jgi:peptidylprolyl isomerase